MMPIVSNLRRHMTPIVSNPLSTSEIITSNIYWSSQTRFLIASPKYKLESQKKLHLRSVWDYEFHVHLHPTYKAHFFKQLGKDLRRTYSSLGLTKKVLNSPFCTQNLHFLFPSFPSFLPRNTKDENKQGKKQDFLLQGTTTHPPTIRALQTAKTTKLGLLSLPHWFLTESWQY